MVKIGLLFFMSMIVFPFVPINGLSLHSNNLLFLGAIVREVSIGLIIGFAARLLFAGIQIAGQLIDYEMGFGFVNVVDPESRLQIPIMGQFLYIFAIFIFLLIDGHHWLVQAMVKSFQIIPLDGFRYSPNIVWGMVKIASYIFVIGFKVSAPLVMSLFLIDLAYGVIARTVPQANIMIVGFPVKIGLGLFFAVISLPLFFLVIKRFFTQALLNFNLLMRLF